MPWHFMISGPTLGCSHWWGICLHSCVMMSLCQKVVLCASIVNVAKVTTSYFSLLKNYSEKKQHCNAEKNSDIKLHILWLL